MSGADPSVAPIAPTDPPHSARPLASGRAALPRSYDAWPELDLLRGLAVVAMVLNHAVATWYGGRQWSAFAHALFFAGGFAPVLFFFATGFGTGLQARRASGQGHRYGFLRKLVILLVADQFILWRWGPQTGLGLDFLGFIGLSIALLEPLRSVRRPERVALLLLAVVLGVRFVLSPLVMPDPLADERALWFAALTGRVAVSSIAYPPFPWLGYPLIGFLIGHGLAPWRAELLAHTGRVLGALALTAGLGVAASLAARAAGLPVSRYGLLSLGYFPLGLAAVATAAAVAWFVSARDALARVRGWLSLRGISSLAVVPIHFALIFALGRIRRPAMEVLPLAIAIAAVAVLAIAGARLYAREIERLESTGVGARVWTGFALFTICAAFTVLGPWEVPAVARHLLCAGAQLCLCGMLVLSPPRAALALRR